MMTEDWAKGLETESNYEHSPTFCEIEKVRKELQSRLAAGEAKNTETLVRLALRHGGESAALVEVWDKIGGFTQDIPEEILRNLSDDLDDLVDQAVKGTLGVKMIRNFPCDCPTITAALKPRVNRMIQEFTEYKPTRLSF
jgi:hypothetical protein